MTSLSIEDANQTHILQAALEWQVTLWSGEVTEAQQRDFQQWLEASPAHQQAWRRVQGLDAQLGAIPGAIGGRVLRKQASVMDRRKLLGLALFSATAWGGYGIVQTPQWQLARADYRSERGRPRDVKLPDGTLVTLNTASAIDVEFTDHVRRIHLRTGEIHITTAQDSLPIPRPFMVETTAGAIRPIGTRFSVRQMDDSQDSIQIQIFEGAVEVTPRQGQPRQFQAGNQILFDRAGITPAQALAATDDAWTRGLLIAERQRLGDFIANLNRYRHGLLRCDPHVADLIVSGVYPLDNTDAILKSLEEVLPVRVKSFGGFWVTLTAR